MLSSPQTAIPAIRINDADNVGVAMAELAQDTAVTLDAISVTLTTPIPVGHKFAIGAISQGEPVIKYGETIGFAMCDIEAGAHIHTHNLVTSLAGELAYDDVVRSAPLAVEKSWWDAQTFRGY